MVPNASSEAWSAPTSSVRASPSAATSRSGSPVLPSNGINGRRISTASAGAARSAFVIDTVPPSMYQRSPIATGGQTPGTAQLAVTAASKDTPESGPKTRRSPDSASIPVIRMSRSGHSSRGNRARTAPAGLAGSAGLAVIAIVPSRRIASRPSAASPVIACMTAASSVRSMSTEISAVSGDS